MEDSTINKNKHILNHKDFISIIEPPNINMYFYQIKKGEFYA